MRLSLVLTPTCVQTVGDRDDSAVKEGLSGGGSDDSDDSDDSDNSDDGAGGGRPP